MEVGPFSQSAVLLAAHGSSVNADSAAAACLQAENLRRQGRFAEVRVGFWKQEPRLRAVLDDLTSPRVFIVPLCVSEGWFTQEAIPVELGFKPAGVATFPRAQARGSQLRIYCEPVGTHAAMTEVLLDRAEEVTTRHPFPRCPRPSETALLLVGHGTQLNGNSRRAVEAHAESIQRLNRYAETGVAFMEEPPLISEWPRITKARYVVVVPFFISDGLHVREDIPVLLGAPENLVKRRVAAGQVPWRNPTAKHERLVWYADAVGTDPMVTEVILARISESADLTLDTAGSL